jgi:dihydroorotase
VYDLIVEDATIVRPDGRIVADVAVEGGRIVHVGPRPAGAARQRVSAAGRFLVPGLIDTHVHFRDPGHPHKEDWASGSRAAVSGGVTTVCDMPNTNPPTLTRVEWEEKRRRAAAASRADFGLWVGAASGNHDAVNELMESGDACGIKVFMGASTGPLLVDPATLERLFRGTRGLIGVHAEDEAMMVDIKARFAHEAAPSHSALRPPEVAAAAVSHLLGLVRAMPRPVHICHVSTQAEIALVEAVRGELPVTTEACPHHLFLSTDTPQDNFTKVNPPIRSEADRRALWDALSRAMVDTVGSDHAPHTHEEKARPYWDAPSGIPGVETIFSTLMAAVRGGQLTLERFVDLTSGAPARIFGFGRKGRIAEGFDADLVLFGADELVTLAAGDLLTRVGWSPFVGRRVAPKPDAVYVRGRLVAERGRIVDDDARGTLVRPGGA